MFSSYFLSFIPKFLLFSLPFIYRVKFTLLVSVIIAGNLFFYFPLTFFSLIHTFTLATG